VTFDDVEFDILPVDAEYRSIEQQTVATAKYESEKSQKGNEEWLTVHLGKILVNSLKAELSELDQQYFAIPSDVIRLLKHWAKGLEWNHRMTPSSYFLELVAIQAVKKAKPENSQKGVFATLAAFWDIVSNNPSPTGIADTFDMSLLVEYAKIWVVKFNKNLPKL